MQIGIVYQDGRVHTVYDSGDYAADTAKRYQVEYPQYTWTWSYNTVFFTKVKTVHIPDDVYAEALTQAVSKVETR